MKINPSRHFESPQQVLSHVNLTIDDKIEILTQWKYDAQQREVAEGENMPGKKNVAEELRRVSEVLSFAEKSVSDS